jgi:heme-degrading monooxygenase HmoA
MTFARVHTLETTSDQHDQGLAAVIEEILPWLRESTGFRGLIRLANAETGKVMAITLWATEQDLNDSAEAAKRLTELTATGVGATWISVENYEVSLFDLGD